MRSGMTFEEAERAQRDEFRRVVAAISEGRSDQEILDRLEHRMRGSSDWRRSRSTDPGASSSACSLADQPPRPCFASVSSLVKLPEDRP